MTPDEIASRTFAVVLRGFDRGEVESFLRDVAERLEAVQGRLRECEVELEAATERARDAEERAQDAEERARTAASAVEAVARREDVEASAPASERDRDLFRELADETARVLAAAEEAARNIRDRAQQRGEAELATARSQGREELDAARRAAADILAEAEAARAAAHQEVRRLEEVRGRFAAQLRQAHQAVDGFVQRLSMPTGGGDPAGAASAAPLRPPAPAAEADGAPSPASDERGAAGRSIAAQAVASRPVDGPGGAATGPAPPDGSAEPSGHQGGGAASSSTAPDGPDPLELRERVVDDTRTGMVDDLAAVLAGVRAAVVGQIHDGVSAVDDLIPADEDLGTLDRAATPWVGAAYTEGRRHGRLLAGARSATAPVPSAEEAQRLVVGEVAAAGRDTREVLRAALRGALERDDARPDDRAAAVESAVGALRDTALPAVAERHLGRAYHRGVGEALQHDGVTAGRWVVGEEADCPDDRCRRNADAGPVELGSAFPSGHATPPAHDDCRCALQPQ